MLKQTATEIVDAYLDGVSTQDVDKIMSLYAQDCRLEDPVGGDVQEGFDAVKTFYSALVGTNISAIRQGEVRVTDNTNAIAFAFQVEVDLGGSVLVQDIIDVFRCDEDNKIVSMEAFWGSDNAVMK